MTTSLAVFWREAASLAVDEIVAAVNKPFDFFAKDENVGRIRFAASLGVPSAQRTVYAVTGTEGVTTAQGNRVFKSVNDTNAVGASGTWRFVDNGPVSNEMPGYDDARTGSVRGVATTLGLNPGGQVDFHMSFVADPAHPNVYFLGGDTHQYYPELVYDNHSVEPEKTPEEGYHLTEDLVDKAISFIADSKQIAPNKPYFLYFCTGAMHAPHHVPREWADRYRGQFDDGWEAYREKVLARQKALGVVPRGPALSHHDPDVQPWASLSERSIRARESC